MKYRINITVDDLIWTKFCQKYPVGTRSEEIEKLIRLSLGMKTDEKTIKDLNKEIKADMELIKAKTLEVEIKNEQKNIIEQENRELIAKQLEQEQKVAKDLEELPNRCVFCFEMFTDKSIKTALFKSEVDKIQFYSHKACFLDNGDRLKEIMKKTEETIVLLKEGGKSNGEVNDDKTI